MEDRRFLVVLGDVVRPDHVQRERIDPDVRGIPRKPDSYQPHPSDLAEAARVLSRADRGGHLEQLHIATVRVIDKDQFTQRLDFVQSASSTWMGRYSHSRDDEISPNLKLNGTKLVNRIHQAMVGNTRTLSPTVVNETIRSISGVWRRHNPRSQTQSLHTEEG